MPGRYDSDDNSHDSGEGDREISLGTGTVLGIFLALALVCSLFFGLGYSMGRKSVPGTGSLATAPSVSASSNTGKPSSNGLARPRENATSGTPATDLQVAQPSEEGLPSKGAGAASSGGDRSPITRVGSHSALSPLKSAGPSAGVAAAAASDVPPTPQAVPGEVQNYVQVAAVSRKEDAALVLEALKKRGYAGLIRQQTQDKLLHIQVGPFPSKKEAEAMRQRLIVDGYNPILK